MVFFFQEWFSYSGLKTFNTLPSILWNWGLSLRCPPKRSEEGKQCHFSGMAILLDLKIQKNLSLFSLYIAVHYPQRPAQHFSICKTQNPCPCKRGKRHLYSLFANATLPGQIPWWLSKAGVPQGLVFLIKNQSGPRPIISIQGQCLYGVLTLFGEWKQITHSSHRAKARRKSNRAFSIFRVKGNVHCRVGMA